LSRGAGLFYGGKIKIACDIVGFCLAAFNGYDRDAAMNYVSQYWNNPNHDCNANYDDCTPYQVH
jgi:hypothetical protein